jgi:hypothetical protein
MPRGIHERPSLRTRLFTRVDRLDDGCWQWLGNVDRLGYGRCLVRGRTTLVHRVVYELIVGPIPQGREIDHTCRKRSCVNPGHLDPVSHSENVIRGNRARGPQAMCRRGHPLDYFHAKTGKRGCRTCRIANGAARRAQLRIVEETQMALGWTA